MHPGPEGQVLGVPGEVHVVGIGEVGLVRVGRADADADMVTLVHRAPTQLDVLLHHARDPGHRCLPPQQLLHRGRDDRGVLHDQPPLFRVLGQIREEALQRVGHRVEAGQEEEETDAEDLVIGQPVAARLGAGEHAQQILPRLLAPVGQGLGEEALNLARVHALIGLHFLQVVPGGTENPVLHPQEHRQFRHREPEQPQEDRRREGLGQCGGELAGPVLDETVDQLVHQACDVRLDQVHPLRSEDRVQQLAVLRVLRWVHLQRDERHGLPEVDRLHGRGEDRRGAAARTPPHCAP